MLVPLNCEYFALEGIAELMATIERVKREPQSRRSRIEGVLLTMYDERTNLGQQVSANIREFFGDQVYKTVIPRNIRLGEAPSHGVPVILYDARSRGAEAYVTFAHEFAGRRRRRRRPSLRADRSMSRRSHMADKRPALGRGLSALIPSRRRRRPIRQRRARPRGPTRARHRSADAQSAPAARAHGRSARSKSSRSPSAATA